MSVRASSTIIQRNEQHKLKPPTNAQFSFTVKATGSSIQSIQPNAPEDGHVDARNM